MKVIDFPKKEKPSASDMLQAAADFASEMEDEGLELQVVTIIQMKGVPSIQYSNVSMDRMATLLDYAKWDLITALINDEYTEEFGEDDDDTVH